MKIPYCFRSNSLLSKSVITQISVLALTFAVFTTSLHGQTFTRITVGDLVNDGTDTPGCAWGDFDNDGDLDLFLPAVAGEGGGNQNNLLYTNNGDGTFTRVTTGVVVNDGGASTNGSWGDFDNDGDLDLFVSDRQNSQKNFLYANNGAGTFTKITEGDVVNDAGSSFSNSWVDFDNDGNLDLFVANGATSFPQRNFLYQSTGAGTFTKITEGDIVNDVANFSTSSWADYDNDGDSDLFVAQDANKKNFLYTNNGDGTFTKITEGDIVNDLRDSRSASWGDYDNDGDLDLFLAEQNFPNSQNNSLYQNDGDGTFTKISEGSIVTDGGASNGSSWGDFDNDGDLDLFVANFGANFLYAGNGDGTFTRIATGEIVSGGLPGSVGGGVSVGSSWSDFDNDGDLDLFVGNVGGINFLFSNHGNSNSWINIKCVGNASNTAAIGTRVEIKATINGVSVRQTREISGQTGNGSQNSLRVHFGLGDAVIIDSLSFKWPSGNVDSYANVSANDFYEAVETTGLNQIVTSVNDALANLPEQFELSQNYPNPFNPSTTIQYNLPENSAVTLKIFNILGHEIRTLAKQTQTKGSHAIVWDGRNDNGSRVSSGVYMFRIEAGSFIQTKKMIFVK